MERGMLMGVGSGVLAGALWGLVFLAPNLTQDFTALQISAARYLAYGAIAALLAAPGWNSLRRKLTRADWLSLIWLGLSGNIVYYVFLAVGVRLAGPATTSLIIGLLPVIVTIVGSREEGAVPLRALAPSLALAVSGVALISWAALMRGGPGSSWQDQAIGIGCAVGALLCWSLFAVGNARCIARLPQISSQDWSLLLGMVTGAECLLLVVPGFLLSPAHHGADAWLRFAGVSAGIAVLASVIGNALWNNASRLLPLTMTAQMVVFETLFALLYSFIWENRWPTLLETVAIAALVAGVWWCAASHRGVRAVHEA